MFKTMCVLSHMFSPLSTLILKIFVNVLLDAMSNIHEFLNNLAGARPVQQLDLSSIYSEHYSTLFANVNINLQNFKKILGRSLVNRHARG